MILHQPGDELNRVVNFVLRGSYMQPHHHYEKVEDISIMEGTMAVVLFDDKGAVTKTVVLEPRKQEHVEIPGNTWHTYLALSDYTISYETMMGKYNPTTWKKFADWAPAENTPEASNYLTSLENSVRQVRQV